ncbi:MAG: DUF6361 family protein [Syntrophales bacterium]
MNLTKAQSQIGWIYFSRDALRRAEARLRAEQEGVRDEIGFLLLHQAYADRFFPGTSVLQTRLRYIFFVPWLYLDLMQSFRGGDFERELIQKEVELTARLKHNKKDGGVIGSRSYPNPTSQPASLVYWTALGTWGLLRKLHDGDSPSRSAVHRIITSRRISTRLLDDDGEPLDDRWRVFVSMPTPPAEWEKQDGKLNFRLRREEKIFLTKFLVSLPSGTGNGGTSLLARLVERRVPLARLNAPWENAILSAASEDDRRALIRARRIAALAAVGRGVYASLVESALEHDGVETDRLHRDTLKDLIDEFRMEALKLDIPGILSDFPNLKGKRIIGILDATKAWLADGGRKPNLLQTYYEAAELARKGPVRAKLLNTPLAKERRREWSLNKGSKSEPLHYRWKQVRRLLMDLQGGS